MSRKRKIGSLERYTSNPHSAKRQKCINGVLVKSQTFKDEEDQSQFQELYKIINGALLGFTPYINKEIAEYATGNIYNCNNKQCDEQIVIFHQDITKYDKQKHSNSKRLGFKYCSKSDTVYCPNCMDGVMIATSCPCKGLYFPSNPNTRCKRCKSVIHDNCMKMCQRCDKNGIISCFYCGHNRRCQGCNKFSCNQCSNKMQDESDGGKCIVCDDCHGIFQEFSVYLHGRDRSRIV